MLGYSNPLWDYLKYAEAGAKCTYEREKCSVTFVLCNIYQLSLDSGKLL